MCLNFEDKTRENDNFSIVMKLKIEGHTTARTTNCF